MSRNKHTPNVLSPFEKPYATAEERREHAAGLRALADWVEETHFPIPAHCVRENDWSATVDVPSAWIDDEGFVKRPGSAARLIGGKVDKGTNYGGGDFTLTRRFGGGVVMRYRISREAVCEKVETTVMEDCVVPEDEKAARALEFHIDELKKELSEMPTAVKKVPVSKTEYVCPPSLIVKETETAAEPTADESVPF